MDVEAYINQYEKNKVWTHLIWPKHQERLKQCASYLIGNKFADVGCVFGHSTYYFNKFMPGNWTGIDFSKRAIKKCIQNFPEFNFIFLESIEKLDSLEPFDSVVCSEVIEHVEQDQLLISKLLSITQNILVMSTPTVEVLDPGHLRIYDRPMLERLFKTYGDFSIEQDDLFFYIVVKNK